MLAAVKEHWNELKSSRPGRRFQERYERRKKEHRGAFHWARWLNIVGGTLLLLIGVFLLAAPGPGMLVAVAGLSMLGSEFLTLARFLDWSEVKVRKALVWARRWWKKSGWVTRALAILLACLATAGALYGGYALFMRS
ncbi:putative transmembrane protein PGPGW [Roseimicrobium gellanilyticum]|uniref:Putative transmembrane protein PGPGW n=1 Tax=Roseimicrobium gellanilyticum TaxID=748857 RepID=A0A366HSW6_9BACT|nr:PGPGW domain-containing protein [Roseimicrobium gellanilyticum]RBP46198.1 putative transmembrane protein PGPGW [Roseimicrobium gellanilyticum]